MDEADSFRHRALTPHVFPSVWYISVSFKYHVTGMVVSAIDFISLPILSLDRLSSLMLRSQIV
jgi:hypothetical protein